MKRLLLAILFICCASFAYAQKTTKLNFPKHSFGIRAGALYSKVPQSEMLLSPENHLVSNSWEEMSEYKYLTLNGAGFHIGGVYEVALTKTNRWFFQTGLDLQYINTIKKKNVIVEDQNSWNGDCWNFQNLTANSLFIDIPMMFSYKFPLGKDFGIYPSFGLTHTIGLYSCLSGEREGFEYDYNVWTGEVERISTTEGLQPFEIKGFRTDYEKEEYNMGIKEQPLHYQLSPYSRYHLNFRAEVNFIIKNNIVLGVNTSFMLLNSMMDGLFSGDSQLWCNVGLSVGYNF